MTLIPPLVWYPLSNPYHDLRHWPWPVAVGLSTRASVINFISKLRSIMQNA